MEKIVINCEKIKSTIKIGKGIIGDLKKVIHKNKCFFVIDKFIYENFYDIYFKDILDKVEEENIFLLESKEENKNVNTVLSIIDSLSKNHLRDSILIGIGGGVIGDIIGFVASVYMRGIKFINVPTTLLSQIDSSIGGKNAVNFKNNKNLIGTFNHPLEVIIDINFLNTISKRELVSGLAEVIKYGIVFEEEFLNYIYNNLESILKLEKEVILNIVLKSCKFKVNVVEKDQYDLSLRKVLNFGHTIGHAIESVTQYSLYTHGEAVLIGMFYETCISYKLGFINEEYFNYIVGILRVFKVSVEVNILENNSFYEALLRDKKNRDDKVSFIFPVGPSKVSEYMLSLHEIKKINYATYCF